MFLLISFFIDAWLEILLCFLFKNSMYYIAFLIENNSKNIVYYLTSQKIHGDI